MYIDVLSVIISAECGKGGIQMFRSRLLVGLAVFLGLISGIIVSLPAAAAVSSAGIIRPVVSTADHSKFKELDRKFTSGPEVTKACLKCHNLAASQVHDTVHWTWDGRQGDKRGEGKAKTLNNF